ncbi:hypothetical protein F3Y22_tig00000340pilonHSYRG00188 [Hibiscus syriacus]|uniref:PHD finger protein ALFIN-LIKE n=1 Tax=Hibiscus syriacus TaxID=106335 RepID=A0A6A3D0H9_HIBSY|nr:PHD finger protein ALFIN-LIKE 3-like [Hibiscus syriacus]KAE8735305.1 hypothetical protein F3Y22_tig00000340pilonHSYRG00188 [Hibiscus syriacus]
MEGSSAQEQDTAVYAVFRDFQGRRLALIKALTTDFEEFQKQCDPDKKEDLCLYGHPDGKWEVKPPVEDVPPDIPEPFRGINCPRDGNNWLLSVAVASDTWLIAVAFHLGAVRIFGKANRNSLFTMINELPTLFDIVSGNAKEKAKGKPPDRNPSRKRFNPSAQAGCSRSSSRSKGAKGKERLSSDDEECGACGGRESHEDWICCDLCSNWFHDLCVNITPHQAEQAEGYECPYCLLLMLK